METLIKVARNSGIHLLTFPLSRQAAEPMQGDDDEGSRESWVWILSLHLFLAVSTTNDKSSQHTQHSLSARHFPTFSVYVSNEALQLEEHDFSVSSVSPTWGKRGTEVVRNCPLSHSPSGRGRI